MRKKYLVLLLVALVIGLTGCGKKKYMAPPPVPIAPSNLTAEAISANEINLSWKDNATTEKGVYVYRKTVGDYARVAIMVANATSYNDTGLSPETTYRYKVSAYNDQGESARSNEVTITTPGEPPPPPEPLEPPTNVKATVVSYKQIDISWRDNSDDEDGFNVRCNIGDTRTKTVATLSPNVTEYEHSELQPMTHHKYYIEVFRGEESAGSPQISVTTLAAPVEILDYYLARASMRMFYLRGELKSEAAEPCSVELTAEYHIVCTWSGFEEWETCIYTVDLEALAEKTFFEFVYILQTETAGDKWVECELEITDVEIDY